MGSIDKAVPFFGDGFNRIYPLIMVIYTLLVASNFFDRVIGFFGSWKRFRFQTEADDTDGFDPSGLIILQKGKCILTLFFFNGVYAVFDLARLPRHICLKFIKFSPISLKVDGLSLSLSFFQNDLGWNKGKKLASMLSHWLETSTVWILSLSTIVQYVYILNNDSILK